MEENDIETLLREALKEISRIFSGTQIIERMERATTGNVSHNLLWIKAILKEIKACTSKALKL